MATTFIPKDRKTYYVKFTQDGKTIRKNTYIPFNKPEIAEKLKREIEAEEIKKKNKRILKFAETKSEYGKNISVITAYEKFLKTHMDLYSKKHKEHFIVIFKQFLKIVPEKTLVKDIDSLMISEFMNSLNLNLSSNTKRNYLTYLKTFFNYLVEEDIIVKSPIKKRHNPVPQRKNVVTFNDEELIKIFEIAKKHDPEFYIALVFLNSTGIRPCDLINLRAGDFDFENGIISIKMSKTSREVHFPIYNELKEFLNTEMPEIKTMNNDEKVFGKFTVYTLGRRLRRVKVKLGVQHLRKYNLKTFRKTFATDKIDKGMDGLRVAELLGHTSVNTTSRYYINKKTDTLKKHLNNLGLKIVKISSQN
jgi:integrase